MSASITREEIAKYAYEAYSKTTDNKNFLGKEMPKFADLNDKQKEAWLNASNEVIRCIDWLENFEIPTKQISKHYLERYFGLNATKIIKDSFGNQLIIKLANK